MRTTENVNVTFPIGLKERASGLGVNISYEASRAVEKECQRKEKKE
jgi:post-segregation antitoxin (ccd killing protein)